MRRQLRGPARERAREPSRAGALRGTIYVLPAAKGGGMQRFTLTLEFPDLKPHQWTALRDMAEKCLRQDSEGQSGLDDETDGWDMGFWLFRLLLGGCNVMDVLGEENPVRASFGFEDSAKAEE
jgi:hypothetical protein